MAAILKNKTIGSYLTVIAAVVEIVGLIRFVSWAPNHSAMNSFIVAALVAGLVLDVVLFVKDNDFVIVASVACYTAAAVTLLTDSVGSFVDAYQGIVMFGDASQVGTITSIAITMGIGVLLSIIASFMKRVKEPEAAGSAA